MIAFVLGTIVGVIVGITLMSMLQINRDEKKREEELCSMK